MDVGGDEDAEAFQSIVETDRLRLGISVEKQPIGFRHSIELMIKLYIPGNEIEYAALVAMLHSLSNVQQRGYSVMHLDHGWICATVGLKRSRVAAEIGRILLDFVP